MSEFELSDAITSGIESVTAKWAKQRKAEERHASARSAPPAGDDPGHARSPSGKPPST